MTQHNSNSTDYARPTAETDLLVVVPGQVAVSLEFRNATALAGCTTVDGDGSGRVFIVRNWLQLSSGEERLWSVLQWLNGQAAYPDLPDLQAHLDVENYQAVLAAVEA